METDEFGTSLETRLGWFPGSGEKWSFTLQKRMEMKPAPYCSRKTSGGHDAVILSSDWDDNGAKKYWLMKCEALMRVMKQRHSFFGVPVDNVYLVLGAKSKDLESAVKDRSVNSIVLGGHASVGTWTATDGVVTRYSLLDWVKEAGHCKGGFGFQSGCRVRYRTPLDDDYFLSPAFAHPVHEGRLFVEAGVPVEGGAYLPGSELTFSCSPVNLIELLPSSEKQVVKQSPLWQPQMQSQVMETCFASNFSGHQQSYVRDLTGKPVLHSKLMNYMGSDGSSCVITYIVPVAGGEIIAMKCSGQFIGNEWVYNKPAPLGIISPDYILGGSSFNMAVVDYSVLRLAAASEVEEALSLIMAHKF